MVIVMRNVRAKTDTLKNICPRSLIIVVVGSLILSMTPSCLLRGNSTNRNVPKEGNNDKTSQVQEFPQTFDHVELLDAKHWIVAESLRVLKTQDGGHTWIRIYEPKTQTDAEDRVQGLSFVDERVGFLIVGRTVLRTEDGGNNWSSISSIGSGTEKISIGNCHFVDSMHGWAVGLIWQEGWVDNPKIPRYVGIAFATQDGGRTWQRLNLPKENRSGDLYWGLNDVLFQSAKMGWLVGDRGMIFHTDNGGNTWRKATCADVDYQRVNFIEDQFGWVTYRYRNSSWGVAVTSNGGQSWKLLDDSFVYGTWPVYAVFMERAHGFATSLKLFKTENNGQRWEAVAGGVNVGESAYAFLGRARDRTLVAIGTKDNLLTTLISSNNGATWQASD